MPEDAKMRIENGGIMETYSDSIETSNQDNNGFSMSICSKCGGKLDKEFTFCPYCGNRVKSSCPKCGNFLRDGAKFCDACGEKVLIEPSADVNTDTGIAKCLEPDEDVNAKDDEGNTPLHKCTDVEIAKLLIERGADVNAKDEDGETPLHRCIDADVARVLIEHGADVNARDKYRFTPLHDCDNADVARVLIERGADVNARNHFGGSTPLSTCKNADVRQVLIDNGAKKGGLFSELL